MNSQKSTWKRTALHSHTACSFCISWHAQTQIDDRYQSQHYNNSSNNSSNKNPLHPIRICKWMTMLKHLHYFYYYIIIIIIFYQFYHKHEHGTNIIPSNPKVSWFNSHLITHLQQNNLIVMHHCNHHMSSFNYLRKVLVHCS